MRKLSTKALLVAVFVVLAVANAQQEEDLSAAPVPAPTMESAAVLAATIPALRALAIAALVSLFALLAH